MDLMFFLLMSQVFSLNAIVDFASGRSSLQNTSEGQSTHVNSYMGEYIMSGKNSNCNF
uniref:Uncharacterized protein n=1 Tax=Amphimedon queenslandica TaxID=400682 RepID=A0A1X7TJT4_AMPQE